jgi:ABC-type sugar transport system substrate-binding protein
MQGPLPISVADATPTVKPRVKPKKQHVKKTPPSNLPAATAAKPGEELTPPAATPTAPSESAASAELGALSPGGASSPRQQQVADHISAVGRRLDQLPAATTDEQKKQVSQVRQFLKQAADALKTGDAEGAENLTTKAGLLLDDVPQ